MPFSSDLPPEEQGGNPTSADGRKVALVHQGQSYRLRVTANDTLILTQ